MTDPRNVAHDKKVLQEKKHKGEDIGADTAHAPQPGKKPHLVQQEPTEAAEPTPSSDAQVPLDKP